MLTFVPKSPFIEEIEHLNFESYEVEKSINCILDNVSIIELIKSIDLIKGDHSISLLFWYIQIFVSVWFMNRSESIEITQEWEDEDEPPLCHPDHWTSLIVPVKNEPVLDLNSKIKADKSASKALRIKPSDRQKDLNMGKENLRINKFEPKVVRLNDWQEREIPQDEDILRKQKDKQIRNQKQNEKEMRERKALEDELERKRK